VLPPTVAAETALVSFGERYTNPYPMTAEVLEAGRILYDRYCSVCHGPTGLGDGPILGPGRFPFANNLTLPITVQRTDGYLYAITRVGRSLMPPYGDRINHDERWWVVNYVRYLQQQAGTLPAAPPGGGPGGAGSGAGED
jgi:mono/diheme cytochrome c family protein